ncbi:MAG: hypothetical protein ACHRXM_39205 [Isosphaerales bacterium]
MSFYYVSPDINPEQTTSQKIFNAIQALHLSSNAPRDRQIADRITALHRDAIAEDDRICPDCLGQLKDFFLKVPRALPWADMLRPLPGEDAKAQLQNLRVGLV